MICPVLGCPEPIFNEKRALCLKHTNQWYRKNASAESKEKNLEWQRKRYQERKNDPEFIERRRARGVANGSSIKRSALRSERSELIDAIKDVPCMDCNQRLPPICMDFDHIPERGKKSFNISQRCYTGSSWQSILEEIKKCDIICSNCHRIRTEMRRTENKELADGGMIETSV